MDAVRADRDRREEQQPGLPPHRRRQVQHVLDKCGKDLHQKSIKYSQFTNVPVDHVIRDYVLFT